MLAVIIAKRAGLFALAWLILTGAAPGGLAVGAAAAVAATAVSLKLLPPSPRRAKIWALIALIPGFLWRSVLGGADVAWRALHPKLPVRPGWIDYPVKLQDGTARAMFGAQTSLLPGTLSAGVEGGSMRIHCLEVSDRTRGELARGEARVARALSQQPESGEDGTDG
jgi:multicomponent Na+:H+ antiporter subunit E